jgi:chemotaxis protein CheD
VTTILGSCVAVCLWDAGAKIGGINHYLLPSFAGDGVASPRFGDISIRELLSTLIAMGCDRRRFQAKLFGGACVSGSIPSAKKSSRQRRTYAPRVSYSPPKLFPVVGEDVGGDRGRKLIFATWRRLGVG